MAHPVVPRQHGPRSAHAFLRAYRRLGSVTEAAKIAGIGKWTHYRWLEGVGAGYENYRTAFAAARRRITDLDGDAGEEEIKRRGIDGVLEPVFYKGKPVGAIRKYSDYLLLCFVRARKAAYRESKLELVGKAGGPIQTQEQPYDLSRLSTEELQTIERILTKTVPRIGADGTGAAESDPVHPTPEAGLSGGPVPPLGSEDR